MPRTEQQSLTADWRADAEGVALRVRGLALLEGRGLDECFAVIPAALLDAPLPIEALQPLAGRFEYADGELSFSPRWPFVAGVEYALIWRPVVGERAVLARAHAPAASTHATAEVLAIYPSASVVPLNLLRLHIHFSAPMSEGCAGSAVRMHETVSGRELANVFLPNSLELWDARRTRLTLLLDPGRIKRGLLPHELMGYPLTEGVPITVTVGTEFRDSNGAKLQAAATKHYEVTTAVRQRVEPALWRLAAPAAGTRSSLAVTFDRPLDRVLLEHSLTVLGPRREVVTGAIDIEECETGWRLVPDALWQRGEYALVVDGRLEDLAGNSVQRVFDRDLTRREDDPRQQDVVRLSFSVH